jgi:AraC-like DNA-binding protein
MTERPATLPVHPGTPPGPDPLSDVLRTVRVTGALFFLSELSAPSAAARVPEGEALARGLAPNAQNIISYHVITRGSVWGALYKGRVPPVRLDAGDIVVIPRGDAYWLGMDAETPGPPDLEQTLGFMRLIASGALPYVISAGAGGPPQASVVCGFLGCDRSPFNPLIATLPRFVVIRGARRLDGAPGDRLDRLIDATLAEAQENQPGGASVRLRLSELIFVETIRRYLGTIPQGETGWLPGLRDEIVGRALSLLHKSPSRTWTLPALAKEAGASRSALADRFTKLVGQAPMSYLKQWRMQLAAQMLADGASKVSVVALEVGYDSEAAFSRAFKRAAGVAPAAWRRARKNGGVIGGKAAFARPMDGRHGRNGRGARA